MWWKHVPSFLCDTNTWRGCNKFELCAHWLCRRLRRVRTDLSGVLSTYCMFCLGLNLHNSCNIWSETKRRWIQTRVPADEQFYCHRTITEYCPTSILWRTLPNIAGFILNLCVWSGHCFVIVPSQSLSQTSWQNTEQRRSGYSVFICCSGHNQPQPAEEGKRDVACTCEWNCKPCFPLKIWAWWWRHYAAVRICPGGAGSHAGPSRYGPWRQRPSGPNSVLPDPTGRRQTQVCTRKQEDFALQETSLFLTVIHVLTLHSHII